MRSPLGAEMWGRFDYLEIEPMKRVVFTNGFSNAAGEIVRAPFAANFPLRVLNNVVFSGETTLDMTGTPYEAGEEEKEFFRSMFPSMNQGFTGTLNQLDDYLKTVK
jgi:uncharacterized protein YndB with AHSA1/START domain